MSEKTRGGDRLVIGGVPRADLLPPEFAAEAKLRAQRRGMVAIAVLAVLLVGLGYGYITLLNAASVLSLNTANAETASLLEQQTQYAEVGVVNGQISTIGLAKIIGTSTEIGWRDYLQRVQASLPAGTKIDSVSASTAYPGNGAQTSTSPLGFTSIAEIAFSATTATLPKVSEWIEALALLPGYAGATAGSIVKNDDATYTVTMVLYINEDALANRMPSEEEPDTEEPTPSPTDSPTPTPTATAARAEVSR
jgi:hypothetical protein